jgi:monofunctional biosynthetic peptidoglycan transglycosylase
MQPELSELPWRVVNDTVMGGLSRSNVICEQPNLHFTGHLSLENNGGFASIISRLDSPFEGFTRLQLIVSGDGRIYQLRLKTSSDSRDVAWRVFFPAGDERTEVLLTPGDFDPVIRGEPAFGAEPLVHTPILFIGFMLTSQQPGPFHLQVHALHIVTRESGHG